MCSSDLQQLAVKPILRDVKQTDITRKRKIPMNCRKENGVFTTRVKAEVNVALRMAKYIAGQHTKGIGKIAQCLAMSADVQRRAEH